MNTTLDRRWFIVLPDHRGIMYTPHGSNAAEAWSNFMAVYPDAKRKRLYRKGYRARLCRIVTDAEPRP